MESTGAIITQVLVLFFMVAIGAFAAKAGIFTGNMPEKMSSLVLNVTAPCLILSAFQTDFSPDILINGAWVLAGSIIMHGLFLLLGIPLFKKQPEDRRAVLRFALAFANCGFMGYPVLQAAFGRVGLIYGAIYVVVFNLLTYTLGMRMFTPGKGLREGLKSLVNPGIIATLLGIALFLLRIRLPGVLKSGFEMAGSITSPLSMMIVGARLFDLKIGRVLRDRSTHLLSLLRLIVSPAAALALFKLLGAPMPALGVIVILSAMPSAANTTIFAELYGGDGVFASQNVMTTTLLCVLTIPLALLFLG